MSTRVITANDTFFQSVGGRRGCQKCCSAESKEYKYTNGHIHGKVVLCHDCASVERLRSGPTTLKVVHEDENENGNEYENKDDDRQIKADNRT